VQRRSQQDDRVHRGAAQHDALDRRAVRTADFERLHADAARHHDLAETELVERRQRVRGERQRKPQLARTRGLLDDPHVPARATKRDRRRKATDAGADDDRGACVLSQTRYRSRPA
jgi:hypothetical protein